MCCPFFNEKMVARINIEEASKWVDEIHVTEFNKSFKYTNHDPCFGELSLLPKVTYHPMDGFKIYKKPRKIIPYFFITPVSKWMSHVIFDTAWYNDGLSRNYSLLNSNYQDDDILILSDVDEIIDSRYADQIISAVQKYDVVTIGIHFTLFYFNLFCPKWSGPADYSYRIFAIKGKTMRTRFFNDSDFLRKCGEQHKLLGSVYCLEGLKGFHHSWLGDETFVANKLKSYAHSMSCHSPEIFTDGEVNVDKIRKLIRNGNNIFENTPLVLNDSISLLPSVEKLRNTNPEFFIK